MPTNYAAARLVSGDAPDAAARALVEDGYCTLENLVSPDFIHSIQEDLKPRFEEAQFSIGDFYGTRTKRFGSVLNKSAGVHDLVLEPTIMGLVRQVLSPFCDSIQLNLTQGIEIHPGELIQPPHRDQDMWRASDKVECLINVMWPLTDYTLENGATVIWPGSHVTPKDYVPDFTKAQAVEMAPGSALVWLGSTLHGGGANRTSQPRSGMIISYCLGWLRTFENQFLAYPPEVAKTFSPELAKLIGYQQHRPGLGNHEGRCPSELLASTRSPGVGPFEDSLPDWQVAAVSTFKTAFAPHVRLTGQ